MRHTTTWATIRWAAGLGAVLSGMAGCALETGEAPGEELRSVEQSLEVAPCATSSSTNCWEARGSDQQRDFAFFNALPSNKATKVFAKYWGESGGGYSFKRALFTTAGFNLGYVSHPNGFPSDIISITTFTNGVEGTAQFLLSNKDIYAVSGAFPPPSLSAGDGVNWANATKTTPKDANNQTLCLKEIEVVRIPAPAAAGNSLGLGCDGKLYHLKSGVWQGIASHPGYAGLPSNVTYKSLSRLGSGVGATFHTGSSIWLAGRGTWSPQGTTWIAPVQLPTIKNSAGTTLTPYRVGGQYVITSAGNGICSAATDSCDGDADRVYFYDLGTSSWKRFTGGLPWYPSDQGDVAECTLNDDACDPNQTPSASCGQCVRLYPYYDAISQVGGDFALHHRYSWVWRWRK